MSIKNSSQVLKTFEGNSNGKSYWIEFISEKYIPEACFQMKNHFVEEEPICKALGCSKDDEFFEEIKAMWVNVLQGAHTIVCLTSASVSSSSSAISDKVKNLEKNHEKPNLAGVLLLKRTNMADEIYEPINEKLRKVLAILNIGFQEINPFKRFQTEELLSEMGLFVVKEHRRQGIAQKLLETCDLICKENNLPLTLISCSSESAQNLLKKIGWNIFLEIPIEKVEQFFMPQVHFECKSIQYAYHLAI